MDTYTWHQWRALCRAREPIPFDAVIIGEVDMSRLQIRGSEDDRVRAELRERIGELVRSLYEFAGSGGFTPEEVGEVQKRAVEEVRTLYYALTGYQPTGEEIGAMIDPIG